MILEGDASGGRKLKFIASPIHMSGAPDGPAARAAEAGAAHRRGAGRSPGADRGGWRMSVLYEVANHVATVTIDRPEVLNAVDLADRGRTGAHLGRHRAAQRRPRRGADRRRRAILLRRRGPEEHLQPQGRRVLGRVAARRLRRHRAARDAQRAGDRHASTASRWAAASRWCWAATWSWPAKKPASACPSRWSGACRWTAACCCCSGRSRFARPWA